MCNTIEIITPKKFQLDGLWFGPLAAQRVIVFIHGLGGSAFSKQSLIEKIISDDTAVITVNTRGAHVVSKLRVTKGKKRIMAGAAFEKFEDCVDDIQGAINFVRSHSKADIYLAGHSTGCQKSAYWSYRGGTGVKGIILLAPMSDYAGALKKYGAKKLAAVAKHARTQIALGKGDQLIAPTMWSEEPDSPARFLSLYTPDSIEQSIFSYFDESRPAKMLRAIKIPLLVILAEKDEFADRSAVTIAEWFEKSARLPVVTQVIEGADHGFKGHEVTAADAIRAFID